jgi:hypothetical protein
MKSARTHPRAAARAPAWHDPDAEPEVENDRDARAVSYAASKGAGRTRMEPATPGGHRDAAWGGSLRRVSDVCVGPSREDEARALGVPGRYVPIGYARYISPVADPSDYTYYRIAGWRVAVPRDTPGLRVKELLHRIFYYGPQAAGYVRVGDALVPAILPTGDRATIAETAIDYEQQPLSS